MLLFIAHRGASHAAPENTLASFRLAWEEGADGIEGDFHLAADGELVCIHDETTGRTAGRDWKVAESTVAELRKLDVGSWKSARFAGERIPTLAEVLAALPAGKRLFAELKGGAEVATAFVRTLDASPISPELITVIAFDLNLVAAMKAARPSMSVQMLVAFKNDPETGRIWPMFDDIIATAEECGAEGVGLEARLDVIDESFAAALHEAGLPWHVWTVNEPEAARKFAALGAMAITTDCPGRLREP